MAKAKFTEQQVFQAADSLVLEGKEVTALSLLSKLGGGSLTTIYKHLYNWKSAKEADLAIGAAETIPESVQAAFVSTLSTAWRVAATEAAKQIAEIKEQASDQIDTAQKELQDAIQAIEKLESEIDSESTKSESLSARVTELDGLLQKSQTEKTEHKVAAEQLGNQVKSLESQLERLHKEVDSERKRHQDEVAKSREAANQQIEQLLKELTAQNKQLLDKIGSSAGGKQAK